MVTKVSDFGLTHDVYVNDYYKLHHSALLPVKWLAPEALLDRVFTMKTDVVSNLHTLKYVSYIATYYITIACCTFQLQMCVCM